jgi:hypothetical protein
VGATAILPASVSPSSWPHPHPNGRRSWMRIAGFTARSGPTVGKEGGTVGPLTPLYAPALLGLRGAQPTSSPSFSRVSCPGIEASADPLRELLMQQVHPTFQTKIRRQRAPWSSFPAHRAGRATVPDRPTRYPFHRSFPARRSARRFIDLTDQDKSRARKHEPRGI